MPKFRRAGNTANSGSNNACCSTAPTWAKLNNHLSKKMRDDSDSSDEKKVPDIPVRINVGGHFYTSSRDVMTSYPESRIGLMFSGKLPIDVDEDGTYFLARDGDMFVYVLNFLRYKKLLVPKGFQQFDLLLEEAKFFGLKSLVRLIIRKQTDQEDSHFQSCMENWIQSIVDRPKQHQMHLFIFDNGSDNESVDSSYQSDYEST